MKIVGLAKTYENPCVKLISNKKACASMLICIFMGRASNKT